MDHHKIGAGASRSGVDGYSSLTARPACSSSGLKTRHFVEDVRVRDAIEAIRASRATEARLPTLAEDVDFARDVASTLDLDASLGVCVPGQSCSSMGLARR